MKKVLLTASFALFLHMSYGQTTDSAEVALQVDSLVKVCRTLTDERHFDEAMQAIAAAEKLAIEKLGQESAAYGLACFNHARVKQSEGDWAEAEKWYLKAQDIRGRVLGKDHPDYAMTLNNLANVYMSLSRYEQSEKLHEQAKNIREKALGKDHEAYAASLNNLGLICFYKGDYDKTESYFQETKDIRERKLGKEHLDYAWILNNLGVLYLNMGSYQQAAAHHQEALGIRKKALDPNHPDISASLNNLAVVYKSMGDYKRAESLFLQAIAMKEQTIGKENADYAGDIINLGDLYRDLKQYDRAEALLLEAKAVFEQKINQTEHPFYMTCLAGLGNVYMETGQYDKAEALHIEAKRIRSEITGNDNKVYWQSLVSLGNICWLNKKPQQAGEYYLRSSDLQRSLLTRGSRHLSEAEMQTYIEEYQEYLETFFSFAVDNSKNASGAEYAGDCYDNILFYKGFLLNAAVQIQNQAQQNPELAEQLDELKFYHRQLANEYSKPPADRVQTAEYQEQINAREKELSRTAATFRNGIRQIAWKDVQAALKPGEVGIEFIHFNYQHPKPTDSVLYVALLLKPGTAPPAFIPLFEEHQLLPLLTAPDGKLSFEQIDLLYAPRQDGSNNALYQLIWSPLEPHIRGAKTIHYALSGLLHRLNLSALPVRQHNILAEQYDLVLLNSTRTLAIPHHNEMLPAAAEHAVVYGGIQYDMDSTQYQPRVNTTPGQMATRPRGSAFVYTDSTLRGETWDYLKWSDEEATRVSTALGRAGMRTQQLKGWQATEESIKQMGRKGAAPQILHVSTHGYFFADPRQASSPSATIQPVFQQATHPMMRSGLIMAGANYAWKNGKPLGNREDGILTAYEISQLDLRQTDLVVLSACETSLGTILGNEGVMGLQRAFKIAGSREIVMSLWQVPDYQTQELMLLFYQKYLTQKMPARLAMRSAQLALREKGHEPYYWAGFVVVE